MFLRSQDVDDCIANAKTLARGAIDDAPLTDADRAMLDYAAKLTLTPAAMTDRDIEQLHAAGLSDEQVWEATFTVSIFAMFNRMADAFGLVPPAATVAALER